MANIATDAHKRAMDQISSLILSIPDHGDRDKAVTMILGVCNGVLLQKEKK